MKHFLYIFVATSVVPCVLLATDCGAWIKHLALEHHVSVLNKGEIKNSSFRYIDLPNSQYRISVPRSEEQNWNIETRGLPSGSTLTVYNQAFGYSVEYDKNGSCVNTTGFSYDNMERHVPKSLEGRTLEFNYDWTACEKVAEIAKKKPFLFTATDYNEAASTLKKTASKDYGVIAQIAKLAGNSYLKKVSPSSVAAVISKCIKQNAYLELSVKKPVNR